MSKGIIIIGPSGSGKTTLGRAVAEQLGYPYFNVDDYIWRKDTARPYTVMYSRNEKIEGLTNAVIPYEHFVMAGSMSSFHQTFDDMFEMMVLLYVEPDLRVERVHKRAIERFGERVLKDGDMYENHMKFLEYNREYEGNGSPNLKEQKEWMNSVNCIRMELDGADSIKKNANKIVARWNTQ